MKFGIACISSRVATDEALDRAKRLIDVLAHPAHLQGDAVYFYHTGTPFERSIATYFENKFGAGKSLKINLSQMDTQCYKKWVRECHPCPGKLSKKSFRNLCNVAAAIDNSHVLMTSYVKNKGRAVVATKMAVLSYIPTLNLSSNEAETSIKTQELVGIKYDLHLMEQKKHQRKLVKQHALAREVKKDAFLDGLTAEMDLLEIGASSNTNRVRSQIIIEASHRYNIGLITSPKIGDLEIVVIGSPDDNNQRYYTKNLNFVIFADEMLEQEEHIREEAMPPWAETPEGRSRRIVEPMPMISSATSNHPVLSTLTPHTERILPTGVQPIDGLSAQFFRPVPPGERPNPQQVPIRNLRRGNNND